MIALIGLLSRVVEGRQYSQLVDADMKSRVFSEAQRDDALARATQELFTPS